ncbi:MAG: DUF3618 domain-containing protein [Deltaproteobacteria bacterium]|nr:DUF3618 domain-containing protein [Deltaproteobacteria bacterium]
MTRTSAEIEREVEATREDLDRTLDALKDKMSAGQLIDEFSHYFKGSSASDMFSTLGAQVRQNPMALAMVGAGLAWLMSGKGSSPQVSAHPAYMSSSTPSSGSGTELGGADKASAIAGQAFDKLNEVKDRVATVAEQAVQQVRGAAGHAKHGVQNLGARTGQAGQTLNRGLMDLVEREPLLAGAMGIAAGLAVGAVLPSTPVEDRAFGGLRDKVVDKGARAGEHLLDDAKHGAAAALQGVREEAERQGLVGAGEAGSIIDKASSVLKAGFDAGRDELKDRAN